MKMSMWAASSSTVHAGASCAGLSCVGLAHSSSDKLANVASRASSDSSSASTISSYERVPAVMVRPPLLQASNYPVKDGRADHSLSPATFLL